MAFTLTYRQDIPSEDFFSLIDAIRERYPDMSIATDLISGFPGESNEDHEESVALIRRLRADTVNITRFSPDHYDER